MNKQPLFVVSQLSRKDAFSVSTQLLVDNKGKYFLKKPNTEQSKTHLKAMVAIYGQLKDAKKFSTLIAPAPAIAQPDGSVRFPFIEGQNAERMLVMSILEKRTNDATAIIDKLLAVIEALPAAKRTDKIDDDFSELFGNLYEGEADLVHPGLIDFNLDNVLQDKNGKWHLIDYEWAFRFPVPKNFIIQRFFYWFFVQRYQGIIGRHAERIEQVYIAPGLAVPSFIYDRYTWAFEDIDRVPLTESKVQLYVTGQESHLPEIELFDSPARHKVNTKQTSLITEYFALAEHAQHLATQLEEANAKHQALDIELNGSMLHRSVRKFREAKKRVTKK